MICVFRRAYVDLVVHYRSVDLHYLPIAILVHIKNIKDKMEEELVGQEWSRTKSNGEAYLQK